VRIRGNHPYAYRSGEWAELVTIAYHPETGHECYVVIFPDGRTDWWAVDDGGQFEYEFQTGGLEQDRDSANPCADCGTDLTLEQWQIDWVVEHGNPVPRPPCPVNANGLHRGTDVGNE
jgi:hypothetical protein